MLTIVMKRWLRLGLCLLLPMACSTPVVVDLEQESRLQFVRWSIRAEAAKRSCLNVQTSVEAAERAYMAGANSRGSVEEAIQYSNLQFALRLQEEQCARADDSIG